MEFMVHGKRDCRDLIIADTIHIPYTLPRASDTCELCRHRNDSTLAHVSTASELFPKTLSSNHVGFYPLFLIAYSGRIPPPTIPASRSNPSSSEPPNYPIAVHRTTVADAQHPPVLACLVPKNGCSEWRRLAIRATDAIDGGCGKDLMALSPHTKGMHRMLWFPRPALLMALRHPGVPRLMIARNPYARILSAYLDKVREEGGELGDLDYGRSGRAGGKSRVPGAFVGHGCSCKLTLTCMSAVLGLLLVDWQRMGGWETGC